MYFLIEIQGWTVDALTQHGDEGRSTTTISLGEMSSNRYIRGFPNGETYENLILMFQQ